MDFNIQAANRYAAPLDRACCDHDVCGETRVSSSRNCLVTACTYCDDEFVVRCCICKSPAVVNDTHGTWCASCWEPDGTEEVSIRAAFQEMGL